MRTNKTNSYDLNSATPREISRRAGTALACLAMLFAAFAANAMPPMGGGRPMGGGARPAVRNSAPARQQKPAKVHNNNNKVRKASPAAKQHNAAAAKHNTVNKAAPAARSSAPNAMRKGNLASPAAAHPANHVAPVRPDGHKPCGRLHPRGHHIGPRHIPIVPPEIVIDEYYWTEEVEIDGEWYILYCYPDGTKRFSDGTIYCYI